ncbi:uncharacterized protein LOC124919664 [Impatiens glandulifera]|uniref:uncharacterized protein LOC124919664 n=1 Tax=Impatiens glandulifera TaxID=253017 RepID=UPI001FB175B9|nr:uncharacterized protein LOC124919664 [Impatiens glandulifera]
MSGLLAWAADVVGGGGHSNDEGDSSIPLVITPEQQQYVRELDRKASALTRSIQDLRLRLPPQDISQRLPHLHAHSIASNAALALQLNAHSATREQAQIREVTLQKENTAYEKAILDCENKIGEKLHEAESLQSRLQELDLIEKSLVGELESALAAFNASQSGELLYDSTTKAEDQDDAEMSKSDLLEKLENKRKELFSLEGMVQDLEKRWAKVQEHAMKQPSPAQREKNLDKQLHSLMEQLAAKQAQAEGLVSEIHMKEVELERVNGLWRRLETSTIDVNTARNRFGRSNSDKGPFASDYNIDPYQRLPYHTGGRTESQERIMLLRSAFVVYILALHILVFIKLSF